MLINCTVLRGAGLTRIPDFGGFHAYDLVLSLECLLHGLFVLVNSRLYVSHDSGGDLTAFNSYTKTESLQEYLSLQFTDHVFNTINGNITIDNQNHYRYLDLQHSPETGKKDLVALYDTLLRERENNDKASLAVCIRSQFNRRALFDRCVSCIAASASEAIPIVDLQVVIITDQPKERYAKIIPELREAYPILEIEVMPHAVSPDRSSRFDLLIAAFDKVKSDYIWFVDDDDFILPGGLACVARSIRKKHAVLLALDCIRFAETWSEWDSEAFLMRSEVLGRTAGRTVFDAYAGDNSVPICGLIFPTKPMRAQLNGIIGRTAYYEDYFLLLAALASRAINVEAYETVGCGISVRGRDNTVNEEDRSIWKISLSTVLGEIINSKKLAGGRWWRPNLETQHALAATQEFRVRTDLYGGAMKGKVLNLTSPRSWSVRQDEGIRGYVDSMRLDGSDLVVTGWAANLRERVPVQQIVVTMGDELVALASPQVDRRDVGLALGMPEVSRCGFFLRLQRTTSWPLGRFVRLYAAVGESIVELIRDPNINDPLEEINRKQRVANGQVEGRGWVDDCGLNIVTSTGEVRQFPVEDKAAGAAGRIAGYIDETALSDGGLSVSGWAYDLDGPEDRLWTCLSVGNKIVAGGYAFLDRPDVQNFHSLPQMKVGFRWNTALTTEVQRQLKAGRIFIYGILRNRVAAVLAVVPPPLANEGASSGVRKRAKRRQAHG